MYPNVIYLPDIYLHYINSYFLQTFYNKFNTSLIKDLLHFSKSHLFSERIREIFFMNFTDAPYQDSLMVKFTVKQ